MTRLLGVLVLVIVLAGTALRAGAGWVIDLALPGDDIATVYGPAAEIYFGADLAAGGDINGDGLYDMAIGAPNANGPNEMRSGAGGVYVYFGKPKGGWTVQSREPDVTIHGEDESDFLGGSISRRPGHITFGDIDGDGIDDLILSAPFHVQGPDAVFWGKVYIVWGQQGDWPKNIDLASTAPGQVTAVLPIERDRLGVAIAVGDLDGNGVADLAMTAPAANAGSDRTYSGKVHVLFGGNELRGEDIYLGNLPQEISSFTVYGRSGRQYLGTSLAIGRLSNDDIPDLVVGCTAPNLVDVLFGDPRLRGLTWDLGVRQSDWEVIGSSAHALFGYSVTTGDLNGDGQSDLLIGAPASDGTSGLEAGQVLGFSGPLVKGEVMDLAFDTPFVQIIGSQGGDDPGWLGESVALGDINGDGIDDLVIGARQENRCNDRKCGESGIVHVFFGNPDLGGVIDLRDEAADITILGPEARAFLGYVTTGDVSGGDIDEVIASATEKTGPNGEERMGAAYILFGESWQVEQSPTPTATVNPTSTVTATPSPTATPTVTPTPGQTPAPGFHETYLPLVLGPN